MDKKLHGKTRTAILETIRICKDKNVLTEYLLEREKEVDALFVFMLVPPPAVQAVSNTCLGQFPFLHREPPER